MKRRSIPTETIPVAIAALSLSDGRDGSAVDGSLTGVVASGQEEEGDDLPTSLVSIVYTTIIGSSHRIDLDASFT